MLVSRAGLREGSSDGLKGAGSMEEPFLTFILFEGWQLKRGTLPGKGLQSPLCWRALDREPNSKQPLVPCPPFIETSRRCCCLTPTRTLLEALHEH